MGKSGDVLVKQTYFGTQQNHVAGMNRCLTIQTFFSELAELYPNSIVVPVSLYCVCLQSE